MQSAASFEQVLADFSAFVIPFSSQLGGPYSSMSSASILTAIKPFLLIFVLNFFTFSLTLLVWRIGLRSLEAMLDMCLATFRRARLTILRATQSKRPKQRRRTKRRRGKTCLVEDEESFKSWDKIARGTVFASFDGHLPAEVRAALNVLGLHAFSTETEIRKAYLTLMKKYHPDRFMHEPTEFEKAQDTAVRIREAYDLLSKPFYQVQ